MSEVERAASFFLGKQIDPQSGAQGEAVQYDARDLTTHAVCVGMTGSGKTGLCIDLLEEATLDGIPSIIIDPKGDITNLLLTFPDLAPADFLPWINVDDARRKGMTEQAYAEYTAKQWSDGLAQWDQGPERIRRLKESAEFTIFTPGSDAGQKVSILQTFAAPALSWDDEEELLREKIAGIVSALLGLAGVSVESMHSREHVLLSSIFETAWRAGEDLDLAKLILHIQKPPLRKLGVFDVDTYFPPTDRMELAMALNSIIASPSFENWIEGFPLDIAQIVAGPNGRPRVAIFYLAHLSDSERMFFVTLLLQQVITWMRSLSGTTSLRTILYFDEVFGFFPPHPADPPSKKPLLTLMKQARAFGLGVVLVTQNPVDLDYKGLTNAGTWFLGKLQTDRDKMRMLEGLESVASQGGPALDRAYYDRLIGGLKPRAFILHNVHADAPIVFTTRWAMSYLRGPLTRSQIRQLMQGRTTNEPAPASEELAAPPRRARREKADAGLDAAPPTLSEKVTQYFLPVSVPDTQVTRQVAGRGGRVAGLFYRPALLGAAELRFVHAASGIDVQQHELYLLPAEEIGTLPDWGAAEMLPQSARDLDGQAYTQARYGEVPATLADPARLKTLNKGFLDYLVKNRWLVVSYNATLKLYAQPGDTADDFKARCAEAARKGRDAEAKKAAALFATKIDRLEERIRKEENELEQDRMEQKSRQQEELLSAGESILGMFVGRRRTSALSTASRRRRMTKEARADVEESMETLDELKKDLADLQAERQTALDEVDQSWAGRIEDIRELKVSPKRTDVALQAFGVAWVPFWAVESEETDRSLVPAYKQPEK